MKYPEKLRRQVEAGEEQQYVRIRYLLPDPPVSAEEYAAIQGKRRRRQKHSARNSRRVYMLSGKLKCGLCGAAMHIKMVDRSPEAAGGGYRNTYYVCDRRNRRRIAEQQKKRMEDTDPSETCRMPSLNQKEADKAIWKKIVWPHVSDPSRIRREVKDQMEEHDRRPALMDEIERLRGFLEEKGQRVETIKTLAIEGVLKPSEARENRRATEKEIEEFQRAIAEREAEIAGYSEREAVLDDLEQEMVRFRKRLQLYERKDHTEAQPTARLRRKALIDFMGDGNIHAYPEGDHIKLVARSRLVVPHNEDKFCDASVTTGATCSACAEALLEAGASEVRVAALASPYLGLDGVPETTHSNTGPEVAGTI